jgi:hypothetical protein
MDHAAFSEANLRVLFDLVSHRFPQPTRFDVFVETSLQDIETPEEKDLGGESEISGDSHEGQSISAFMMRSENLDLMRVYTPSHGGNKSKTIVLRGKEN